MAGLEQPRGGFDQPDDLDREWAEFAACLDGQLAAIPGSADDVDSELFELINGGDYCLLSRR